MSNEAPGVHLGRVTLTIAEGCKVTLDGTPFSSKDKEYKKILSPQYYRTTAGLFTLSGSPDAKRKEQVVSLETQWLEAVDIVGTKNKQLVVIGHYREGGIPHAQDLEPDSVTDYRCIECSGVIVCGVKPKCVPVAEEDSQ